MRGGRRTDFGADGGTMRTVFIVNPKAGKGRGREKFIKEIEAASKKTGVAVEVYSTRAVGDG